MAEFILERLEKHNVKHIFGVNGDYINEFYDKVKQSTIVPVFNTDESHSGFAANAYARINGMGCVAVNYQVGAYKLINSVACAYVERSPLIIISGSSSTKDKRDNAQFEIFSKITRSAYLLDNPSLAGYLVDKAFDELNHYKQPVYLELPRDLMGKPINYDVYKLGTPKLPKTNQAYLEEAIKEVKAKLEVAKNPVIVAGVELARYNLGAELIRFVETCNIPIITDASSKSVINERHRLFVGMVEKNKEMLNKSDCLIILGAISDAFSSFNKNVVMCNISETRIDNHFYRDIQFQDFCSSLFKQNINKFETVEFSKPKCEFVPSNTKITSERFVAKLNCFLNKNMVLVSESDAKLVLDVQMQTHNQFIGPAFYASTGFAIPGALAIQLAKSNVKPVVVTTTHSCRNTWAELSTCVLHKLSPIIFVLKTAKDTLCFSHVKELFGAGTGVEVSNELELEEACNQAVSSKELFVISVQKL